MGLAEGKGGWGVKIMYIHANTHAATHVKHTVVHAPSTFFRKVTQGLIEPVCRLNSSEMCKCVCVFLQAGSVRSSTKGTGGKIKSFSGVFRDFSGAPLTAL